MSFKVVSTSPTFGIYAREPVEYLLRHGGELKLIDNAGRLSEQQLSDAIRGCDALIVGLEKLSQAVLEGAPTLKVIAKHGAGVDNIDLKAASARGIVVIAAAGTNSDAVADLTIGLFYALARSIPLADREVRHGKWPRIVGSQVSGKTAGIIGFGKIGRKVARRALGLGMKVLAYDVVEDQSAASELITRYVCMDDLLSQSDYISVHVPLLPETARLIGYEELRKMKKTAYLVNVSRGNVVDEDGLCKALEEGLIRGAALDVFTKEPVGDNPLMKFDNVILSPHMAGYTVDALRETGLVCVKGILDVLAGHRPDGLVSS